MSEENSNIKKRYPADDFNPFKVFQWFHKNRFHQGSAAKILVVGNSDRFNEFIVKGFRDTFRDAKVNVPVVVEFGGFLEATTPSGAKVRFLPIEDVNKNHMLFHEQCDWASDVGLCCKYKSPEFLNVIRDKSPTVGIYDFSENNLKKVVDTEED